MAHPVVIMSYDKSPAITAAVAALEEAGMEVIVLNTKTAKLVNFLGALAGTADGDDPDSLPPEEEEVPDATAETDKEVDADVKADDMPAAEEDPALADTQDVDDEGNPIPKKKKTEESTQPVRMGTVEGEDVQIVVVEGIDLPILFASEIELGARTKYRLNESTFAFWPGSLLGDAISRTVNIRLDNDEVLTAVQISESTANPPRLHVGPKFLEDLVRK